VDVINSAAAQGSASTAPASRGLRVGTGLRFQSINLSIQQDSVVEQGVEEGRAEPQWVRTGMVW
jgi:hypothetical protein